MEIFLKFLTYAIVFFILGIRICQEYQRAVVFRLGRFYKVKGPGIYWNIPFIEWQTKVDIRIRTVDIEKQEAITKDNVSIMVNTVLWYKIENPADAILKVAKFDDAVYQVALTTLRNIIGQNYLDDVLKERDTINNSLKQIIDELTDPWGLKVELVETKDVEIPTSMQRAMAREAEAVREKRARIIKAEAELEASEKLSKGAQEISNNPFALELRRMQMISEIGVENNTTTIILMPAEFANLARELGKKTETNSRGTKK
ncbi:MAG: slipin family protein [Leptospiraceae bacterium]|nr:slipin family protein [Leptospiraceae bacterium]